VKAAGGKVVKTLGDGMVCQFKDADHAYRAACDMQKVAVAIEAGDEQKLSIKVGFTFGPVLVEGDDVFGDTVNVCARLIAHANPDQIVTTSETRSALSTDLRDHCKELYSVKVKGRVGEVKVCEVVWRTDPDRTEAFTRQGLKRAMKGAGSREWILKLSHGGETTVVESSDTIKLGRDKANEVVVASSLASRVHARIYGRDGHFMIADQSSNGTFVLIDGNSREIRLRREEAMLGERGYIGLGGPASAHGEHVLRYRLEIRKA
jgi:adenylate cyclase